MNYHELFCANVNRLMQEKKISKLDLANTAGISVSFVSDVTRGKGNPSLKIMDAIATALDVPLPLLLLNPAGEIWSFVSSSARLSAQKTSANAEEITVVLPRVQAFIAKKWALVYSKRKK